MRYFSDSPLHPDEAGYTIEDGVIIDPAGEIKRGRAYDNITRALPPQAAKLEAKIEEARWAARSGPVTVRYRHEEAS